MTLRASPFGAARSPLLRGSITAVRRPHRRMEVISSFGSVFADAQAPPR
mgnify:CR=1